MLVLQKTNDIKVRDVDKNIKNKFRWDWLEKKVTLKLKKGELLVPLSDSIEKVDVPGKAKCNLCNDLIDYGGRGWNSLESHVKSSKHTGLLEVRKDNYELSSSFLLNQPNLPSTSATQPAVPLSARILNGQATVLGFMAEHNLPFSLSPHLINLAKELGRDQKALSSLSMDRTSAAIKMRFGLSESLLSETIQNLKSSHFSLNIDEATSNNFTRVLSVLVSYFNEAQGRVVVEHISSMKLCAVNTKTIYNALHSMMVENNIPYDKLTSILMDSCAVMRGSKSGLETQFRQKQAPHLLDVDGDSCHHIHNATKKFCKEFNFHVEGLFSDLNTDFRWSAPLKLKLEQICDIFMIKYSPPERYLSHRWLSCYDVAVETLRMWDVLTIFYYSYLIADDIETYQPIVLSIYRKRKFDNSEKLKEIKVVQEELKSIKPSTNDGKNRRERILQKLFYVRKKTLLHLQVYTAILPLLKKYVCMFQMTEPLIHKLHEEQVHVFKTFVSCFIKPEVLNEKSITDINLITPQNMLSNKHLFLGFGATGTIAKCNKTISREFFASLKKAFFSCGSYLQKKLPLENPFLINISALNPTETLEKLELLPTIVTNVLSKEELEVYLLDIRKYQIDNLPEFTLEGKSQRLDEWWASVFATGEYQSLSKLVKAVISVFHGPSVESTFSSMNYIIDPRSGRMDLKTYSAIQTVKMNLKAKNISAIDYFHRNNVRFDPVKINICKSIETSNRRYREEKAKESPVEKPKKKLSKTAGQKLLKKIEADALKKSVSRNTKQLLRKRLTETKKHKTTRGTRKIIDETERKLKQLQNNKGIVNEKQVLKQETTGQLLKNAALKKSVSKNTKQLLRKRFTEEDSEETPETKKRKTADEPPQIKSKKLQNKSIINEKQVLKQETEMNCEHVQNNKNPVIEKQKELWKNFFQAKGKKK